MAHNSLLVDSCTVFSVCVYVCVCVSFLQCGTTPHESSWCVSAPWTAPLTAPSRQPATSEPSPTRDNLLSFSRAPGSDWENDSEHEAVGWRGWRGGGGGGGHYYLPETRTRMNRSGRGRLRCRIFLNEITPRTPPPPYSPRILYARPSLVEPPSRWRQEGSLVDESARKSIHSASHTRPEETEEEEMLETPRESLVQLWWGREGAGSGITHWERPYLNRYRAADTVTTSPRLHHCRRRERTWASAAKEPRNRASKGETDIPLNACVRVCAVSACPCVRACAGDVLLWCNEPAIVLYNRDLRTGRWDIPPHSETWQGGGWMSPQSSSRGTRRILK